RRVFSREESYSAALCWGCAQPAAMAAMARAPNRLAERKRRRGRCAGMRYSIEGAVKTSLFHSTHFRPVWVFDEPRLLGLGGLAGGRIGRPRVRCLGPGIRAADRAR